MHWGARNAIVVVKWLVQSLHATKPRSQGGCSGFNNEPQQGTLKEFGQKSSVRLLYSGLYIGTLTHP